MTDNVNDGELRIVVQRVARRIRNNRASGDLGDSQLSVLFHLEARGPVTPGELASLERITPPSMSRTVKGLEDAGFVVRQRATDDARKVLVSLTPRGDAVLAETRRLRSAWFSDELATLSAEERTALQNALPALRKLSGG